jgi:hypothetical protein
MTQNAIEENFNLFRVGIRLRDKYVRTDFVSVLEQLSGEHCHGQFDMINSNDGM